MIEDAHVHQRERIGEPTGDPAIGIARLGEPRGVIVAENRSGSIDFQAGFHHLTRMHARPVYRAPGEALVLDHPMAGIEPDNIESFVLLAAVAINQQIAHSLGFVIFPTRRMRRTASSRATASSLSVLMLT